jgi:hypothetical protein
MNPFEENSAQIDAMERHRRQASWSRSPEERWQVFCQLQAAAEQARQANPEAMKAFIRRNHHQRRMSNVIRLERVMLRIDVEKQ